MSEYTAHHTSTCACYPHRSHFPLGGPDVVRHRHRAAGERGRAARLQARPVLEQRVAVGGGGGGGRALPRGGAVHLLALLGLLGHVRAQGPARPREPTVLRSDALRAHAGARAIVHAGGLPLRRDDVRFHLRQRLAGDLPTSHYISLYLTISPYISLHLTISHYISLSSATPRR